MGLRAKLKIAIGLGVLLFGNAAWAQDNLELGKSAAQLFASDCAICHKSPQGLAKAGGPFGGLQGFLREHYTTSRESAAAIAAYLQAVDRGGGPAQRNTTPRRAAKGDGKPATKKQETKPGAGTVQEPAEAKPVEPKASESKASESKESESKPVEQKPVEAKPTEEKPAAAPKAEKSE